MPLRNFFLFAAACVPVLAADPSAIVNGDKAANSRPSAARDAAVPKTLEPFNKAYRYRLYKSIPVDGATFGRPAIMNIALDESAALAGLSPASILSYGSAPTNAWLVSTPAKEDSCTPSAFRVPSLNECGSAQALTNLRVLLKNSDVLDQYLAFEHANTTSVEDRARMRAAYLEIIQSLSKDNSGSKQPLSTQSSNR